MPIYAKLNSENFVENVIIAESHVINSFPIDQRDLYKLGEFPITSKKPRANIGNLYLPEFDAFVDGPKPFPSWILSEEYKWQPPVPFPVVEGNYEWDEEIKDWRKI